MFAAHTNDGYYNLGLETARLIQEALSSKGELVEAGPIALDVKVPSESSPSPTDIGKESVSAPASSDALIDHNPWK